MLWTMVRFFTLCLTLTAAAPPNAAVVGADAARVEEHHPADVPLLAEAAETVEVEERAEREADPTPWALPAENGTLRPAPLRYSADGALAATATPDRSGGAVSARGPPVDRIIA